MRDTLLGFAVAHGHGVGGGFADEEDFFTASRDRSVDEVALQHHEMRLEQRHDDDGVFAALRLVDADGVGEAKIAEGPAIEDVRLAVEVGRQRAVNAVD